MNDTFHEIGNAINNGLALAAFLADTDVGRMVAQAGIEDSVTVTYEDGTYSISIDLTVNLAGMTNDQIDAVISAIENMWSQSGSSHGYTIDLQVNLTQSSDGAGVFSIVHGEAYFIQNGISDQTDATYVAGDNTIYIRESVDQNDPSFEVTLGHEFGHVLGFYPYPGMDGGNGHPENSTNSIMSYSNSGSVDMDELIAILRAYYYGIDTYQDYVPGE